MTWASGCLTVASPGQPRPADPEGDAMTTYHRITTDHDGGHRVIRVTRDAAGNLIASVLVGAYRGWDQAHATAVRLNGGAA